MDIVKAVLALAALGIVVIWGGRLFDYARDAASRTALRNLTGVG